MSMETGLYHSFILQIRLQEPFNSQFSSCSRSFKAQAAIFAAESVCAAITLSEPLLATILPSRQGLLINLRITPQNYYSVMDRDSLVQCMYWLMLGWLCGFALNFNISINVASIKDHLYVYHAVRYLTEDLTDVVTCCNSF